MTEASPDLLAAMDKAAIALLKRAALSDTTDEDEPVEAGEGESTVSAGVKAFDSVFAFVKWRESMKGPPPDAKQPGDRFRKLQGQFHGDGKIERRTNRRKPAVNGEAIPDAESAEPN